MEYHKISDLWELTNEVAKQSHGTILVITDNAKKEAIRLKNQSFGIKPLKLTSNIAQQVTTIDGAVLVDQDSVCHAIGVILDGLASEKGDSSRGARYNSAIRYFEYHGKKKPTFLILISEDGMVDLIPNLKPQIKHSQIEELIVKLRKMKEVENVKYKDFNEIIDFFEKIEFYLNKYECEFINKLREEIHQNIDTDIRITRKDLKPNSEMNDSYFIKE